MKHVEHSKQNLLCFFSKRERVLIILLFYFFAGLYCACTKKKSTVTYLTVTDDAQQTHNFKAPPKRIVCLVPSITEILYAIEAENNIIAVTEHCNYPEQAQKQTNRLVVYPNVSTEQVLALKPDLILTSTEVMSVKIIEQFKPYNIPVFFVNYKTMRDIPRSMRLLGTLTGLEKKAQFIADSTEKIIENYSQQKVKTRPKMWLIIGTQPLYTAGKNSFMNDIIHLSGGQNIAESITNTAYPVLTREFILSQKPEYILVSNHQKGKIKETLLSLYPEMKVLPCFRDTTRIIGIEEDILVRPTPRSLKAISEIKKVVSTNQ